MGKTRAPLIDRAIASARRDAYRAAAGMTTPDLTAGVRGYYAATGDFPATGEARTQLRMIRTIIRWRIAGRPRRTDHRKVVKVMSEAPRDPYAMTWQRRDYPDIGRTEWAGSSEYHSATVTQSAVGGGSYQARVVTSTGDQYSPYLRTLAAAKAWAERYGRPRARQARTRR